MTNQVLKEGDKIELLKKGTNEVVYPLDNDDIPYVNKIIDDNTVSLERFDFIQTTGEKYKIRRKLNKAFSDVNAAQISYGNNIITSDIQNVYIEWIWWFCLCGIKFITTLIMRV